MTTIAWVQAFKVHLECRSWGINLTPIWTLTDPLHQWIGVQSPWRHRHRSPWIVLLCIIKVIFTCHLHINSVWHILSHCRNQSFPKPFETWFNGRVQNNYQFCIEPYSKPGGGVLCFDRFQYKLRTYCAVCTTLSFNFYVNLSIPIVSWNHSSSQGLVDVPYPHVWLMYVCVFTLRQFLLSTKCKVFLSHLWGTPSWGARRSQEGSYQMLSSRGIDQEISVLKKCGYFCIDWKICIEQGSYVRDKSLLASSLGRGGNWVILSKRALRGPPRPLSSQRFLKWSAPQHWCLIHACSRGDFTVQYAPSTGKLLSPCFLKKPDGTCRV